VILRHIKGRLELSFTWPSLVNDVIEQCKSCEICQKHARVTYHDRIPIEGGVISMEPVFSHFYVDALAPLCSYSIPYQYALVLLDHMSRWMHAIPLLSLTAKNCSEALLSCWQFTCLPTKLTMDNASNFTADITREFLRRLGVSPMRCTPRHPEDSVECTVGTLNSLIAKVAHDHPRSWQNFLPMIDGP